jgi:predicted PolB exonuclease-like 3'-5' exonuclease
MTYLFLDIETTPLEIKDEYVIRYLMDKKLTDASRSLDPNYSKIIVLGLKYNDEIKLLTGEEKDILIKFWNFIKENNFTIVTHNGYGFDIPFIIVRSIINNVQISKEININHWNMLRSNHLDTMIIFSQNTFTNSGLKVLAKLNNIQFNDDEILGRDIERLFKENKIELIKEHCKNDIEILEKLFNEKCKSYIERNY